MVIYSLLSRLHSPNVHACSPLLSSHSTGYISISYSVSLYFFPLFILRSVFHFLFFFFLLFQSTLLRCFYRLTGKKKSVYERERKTAREREREKWKHGGERTGGEQSQFVFIIFSLTRLTRIGEGKFSQL